MTHEHDPLEQELTALRPMAPSAKLAERIGERLSAEADVATPSPGRRPTLRAGARATLSQRERDFRRLPTPYSWLVLAVALAALIFGVIWWSSEPGNSSVVTPFDQAQPTLATALDDSLPSVWTFRPALQSPAALESLLDEHASTPSAGGDPVQTRGFVPVTMNLNSRLGEF